MKTLILWVVLLGLLGGSVEARDGHIGWHGGRFNRGGSGGWYGGSGWGYAPYVPYNLYGGAYYTGYYGYGLPYGFIGPYGYAGPNGYLAPNGYGGPYGYPFDNSVWWDARFHHPYNPY